MEGGTTPEETKKNTNTAIGSTPDPPPDLSAGPVIKLCLLSAAVTVACSPCVLPFLPYSRLFGIGG